ncbi:hypothetical protein Ga0100231_023885 [Opitutaceae bacterium TAV4]|nr:hypothetical protein Ga0100231_023885 [Opitutaceae bacterium TAV4]RRK00753.1 hypothetical protein Ga0100230_023460 [Opitutaceae bacterium TAV3]
MKKYKCWRYKCEHCGKSGCRADAIRDHEARCFKNPARRCSICQSQWPRPDLLALLEGVDAGNEAEKVKEVEKAADFCPACTLAAITQAGTYVVDQEYPDGVLREVQCRPSYDYKAAMDEYMRDLRMEEYGL